MTIRRRKEDRIKDSDLFEVVEEVFDRATALTVLELIRRGCLSKLLGVVSAGKEARVYLGRRGDREVAVKIYLTATAEFKKSIWKYIRGDPRYEWITSLPSHKLMSVWARKEYANLARMFEAGVPVPEPYCVRRNVVVMQFIGEEGVRAPLLKEVHEEGGLRAWSAKRIFRDVIRAVYKMYWYAGLVHGDLSEYNIMLFKGKTYIIDVSQAVSLSHPNAHVFLQRDLENVVRFFGEEVGIEVPSAEELFNAIVERGARRLEDVVEVE